MPTIDEYFARNRISLKTPADVTPEIRKIADTPGEEAFFNAVFQGDYDLFIEGCDYHPNRWLFEKLLEEARGFSDLFEPCCQSGILGCLLALEADASYSGLDLNRFGINRAKERAAANGLSQDIFQLGDVFEYSGTHEAIFGRYVVNGRWYDVNKETVAKIVSVSPNIVLVQSVDPRLKRSTLEEYDSEFGKHGFSFEVLTEPTVLPSTGAHVFVMKAAKKST